MLPKRKRGVLAFRPVRGRGIGLGLLLSLAVFSCSEGASEGLPSAPVSEPPASPESPTAFAWQAFEGRTRWSDREVQALLRPLQASQARMQFDTQAWNLDSGQILWSLQFTLVGAEAGGEPTPQEPDSIVPLTFEGLAVEHANGPALRFRDMQEVPGRSGVYDPIQVLLAAPRTQLVAGPPITMVLAGPADLSGPKLVGLPFELELVPKALEMAQQPTEIPILDYTTPSKW